MINGKKVIVIMPAYNAAKTLEQTYNEIYKFVSGLIHGCRDMEPT